MRATRVDGRRDGPEATGPCQRGGSLSCGTPSQWNITRRDMTPPVSPESVIRFGRHRGQRIADLDDGYLIWLLSLDTLWDATAAAIRTEWHRRAGRRRSWRPVAKAKWGRRLLDVNGRGPFAVVQCCGGFGMYTVWLYETAEQAQADRARECGYDGPEDCQPAQHFVFDLIALTAVPGEAIE